MEIISKVLNYSEDNHEMYVKKVKESMQAIRSRKKDNGEKLYTETHKKYYEQHKQNNCDKRALTQST
jgi:hypothetical protein